MKSIFVLFKVPIVVVELEAQLLEHLDRRRIILIDLHEKFFEFHIAIRPHHCENHRRARISFTTIGLVRYHHVELSHIA